MTYSHCVERNLLVLGYTQDQEITKCDLVPRERTCEFKSWLNLLVGLGKAYRLPGF